MKLNILKTISPAAFVAACIASVYSADAQYFVPGNLVVSLSDYTGTASTVTVGQTLPGGGTAVVNGSYPNVWANEGPDPSFGVTSPIYLDQITTGGAQVSMLPISPSEMTTSFSSKSEMSLNLSTDGTELSFMGYASPANALDVSNSNTPGHDDPTNPVGSTTQRAVGVVDVNGNLSVTDVNDYSGNNGRAAIVANNADGTGANNIYMVGNAGNGSGTEPVGIVDNTGVQMTTVGGSADTTVIGAQQGTAGASKGFQYGYSVTQNGDAADKSGKDDNFRGETVFNNTLYVTKGSGGNGINSVYQVGTAGSLPTAATASSTAISILPGFSTALASSTTVGAVQHPFGIWFANATTLYVADEGDGVVADAGPNNVNDPTAGLNKYSLVGGTWQLDYTLQSGLNLGQAYAVPNYTGFEPATDGLRDLTGKVNADGSVTLYSVTSTASGNTDEGADPNELVTITDTLADTTSAQASGESFSVLDSAQDGQVLRGISFTPQVAVPEPATYAAGFGALLMAASQFARKRKNMK